MVRNPSKIDKGSSCLSVKLIVFLVLRLIDSRTWYQLESVLKSSVDEDTDDNPLLGWFRTMIAIDKTDACRWTDYSQDWSATSLGSMDISVWAITLSPSQLTTDAGCILAILSSNMDLTLWIAGKNALKGEWKKGIDWSSQPNFALSPAPGLDNSFLVAFLKRILVQPLTCIALVAYSTPDGTIGFVRVTQTLRQTAKQTPFALPFTMSTAFEQPVLDTQKGALMALKWVDLPGRLYISARDALVLCLVDGSFHVVYAIAGVACTVPILDYENVAATDLRTTNKVRAAAASNSNSAGVGGGAGTFADVMRTSGMVCYDGDLGTVMWIHDYIPSRPTRPADLSYKHDAKHNSILTVTSLWDGEDFDENVLGAFQRVLSDSQLAWICVSNNFAKFNSMKSVSEIIYGPAVKIVDWGYPGYSAAMDYPEETSDRPIQILLPRPGVIQALTILETSTSDIAVG
ncbi:MAG: hypothetical protein NXY57DRAFT_1043575 [Lentinula lateritia]|nr:MAG: hypothetical protein NXY57DRAFT_1043575 [Lentinula lateritia]